MSNFIIYSGQDFKADFTVVSSDGVTGEQLSAGDTGTFSVIVSGPNPSCVISAVPMTVIDADNGVFELSLTAEQTSLLDQYVGFREDGFKSIGNYNGFLDFKLASGDRQAMITVYVQEAPICS